MTYRKRIHTGFLLSAAALITYLVACGDESGTPGVEPGVDAVSDTSVSDAGNSDSGSTPDASGTPDTGPAIECPPDAGAYGAPCSVDADCTSGICVPDGEDAGVCSALCLEGCDPMCTDRPVFCRGVDRAGEIAFVCQPQQEDLCRGCVNDEQCAQGSCVTFEDGTRACGIDCTAASDCPNGYQCGDGTAERDGQCIPASGTCTCTEANDGLTRPCDNSNEFGSCSGAQICDAANGWGECEADTAIAEICDGLDNDCDGVRDNGVELGGDCEVGAEGTDATCPGILVCQGEAGFACIGDAPTPDICDGLDNDCDGTTDQDFTDESGRYVDFDNCGRCGNSCDDRFPFADEIVCDAERDTPECVITECEAGYQLVGDTVCLPVQPNLCLPCAADTDCNLSSPGAACVTITDDTDPANTAQVCGRDCAPDSPFGEGCPDGYACTEFDRDGEALFQCVPSRGTCACIGAADGFSVPCSVTIDGEVNLSGDTGEVTCGGAKICQDDGGFGTCELPSDVCDGFDNDCSGRIDDAFRDGSGLYTTDAHCGRCNNDCGEVFTPARDNATGECGVIDGTPTCEMVCIDGFVDVFNGTDDGCECEVTSTTDLPDPDSGADQNCDGVDGDISRALFVSKVGTDANSSGSRQEPLASIGAAISRASACAGGGGGGIYCPSGDVRDIYVATGVYSENIVLDLPVSLYGGYSLDFYSRNPVDNPTTIFGVAPSGDELGTLTVDGVTESAIVAGFSIYGVDATLPGESSYAVYLRNSSSAFELSDNRIVAAGGATGSPGNPGGSGSTGADGSDGRLGSNSGSQSCAGTSPTAGGDGGGSVCGVGGGDGGDALCPRARTSTGAECRASNTAACLNTCTESPCTPLPPAQDRGDAGSGNAGCAGDTCGEPGEPTYDFWSDSGLCTRCGNNLGLLHTGQNGQDGRPGSDGSGGPGCADLGGTVDGSGRWRASVGGNAAADASAGGGGGGGSAGAGYDVTSDISPGAGDDCSDRLGGSGGGGGAGGCAGTPGTGGTGGGGSFAVFVYYAAGSGVSSAPTLTANTIVPGRGGAGGNGGTGGAGGLGGAGGDGGFTYPNQAFCTSPGGDGGNGGTGGNGGGGGGGCGGNAYGIFVWRNGSGVPASVAGTYRSANAITGAGAGGTGGAGGISPSSAANGSNGTDGGVFDVVAP